MPQTKLFMPYLPKYAERVRENFKTGFSYGMPEVPKGLSDLLAEFILPSPQDVIPQVSPIAMTAGEMTEFLADPKNISYIARQLRKTVPSSEVEDTLQNVLLDLWKRHDYWQDPQHIRMVAPTIARHKRAEVLTKQAKKPTTPYEALQPRRSWGEETKTNIGLRRPGEMPGDVEVDMLQKLETAGKMDQLQTYLEALPVKTAASYGPYSKRQLA